MTEPNDEDISKSIERTKPSDTRRHWEKPTVRHLALEHAEAGPGAASDGPDGVS